MKNAKNSIVIVVILLLVSAAVLYGVNALTYDKIQEGKIASEINNLHKIFPGAKFEEVDFDDDSGLITRVFKTDKDEYVYKASAQGYSGILTIMIGIDAEHKIVGYEVLEFNDTPNIGDIVTKDSFIDTIVGIMSNDQVDTVSGATYSSGAVVNMLKAIQTHYNALMNITGEGSGPKPVEPSVNLNDKKLSLSSSELDPYTTEITSDTTEGNLRTFVVKAKGYGLVDDDGEHGGDYKENEYKIVVDTTTNTIASIEYVVFGDTKGFGDKTNNEAYFKIFEGLTLDLSNEIDTVTGATRTSTSMISAVKAVIVKMGE